MFGLFDALKCCEYWIAGMFGGGRFDEFSELSAICRTKPSKLVSSYN